MYNVHTSSTLYTIIDDRPSVVRHGSTVEDFVILIKITSRGIAQRFQTSTIAAAGFERLQSAWLSCSPNECLIEPTQISFEKKFI